MEAVLGLLLDEGGVGSCEVRSCGDGSTDMVSSGRFWGTMRCVTARGLAWDPGPAPGPGPAFGGIAE
jgi:hypothetical protein